MSQHWNCVYDSRGDRELSWSENEPATSLALLDLLGVTPDQSVLDVGGGRSALAQRLLERSHRDVSVLDLSSSALADQRRRSGDVGVELFEADVTRWTPPRRFDVWHDRAVLHFVEPALTVNYVETLRAALAPEGAVVIGVFSPEGPASCSGLRVTRYDAPDLTRLLGDDFEAPDLRRVVHVTPWGATQSLQWIAARRRA